MGTILLLEKQKNIRKKPPHNEEPIHIPENNIDFYPDKNNSFNINTHKIILENIIEDNDSGVRKRTSDNIPQQTKPPPQPSFKYVNHKIISSYENASINIKGLSTNNSEAYKKSNNISLENIEPFKLSVMLDRTRHTQKPTSKQTAYMVKHHLMKATSITPQELAYELSNGATFRPALLNDFGANDTDWISNQVFALDFDHGITIPEALNKCVELNILPSFGYTSFSHTEAEHKFRLVFALNESITDICQRDKLQNALCNAFEESDQVTKNPSRLFYGGRSLIYEGYENRIDPDHIIKCYFIPDELKPVKTVKQIKQHPNKTNSNTFAAAKANQHDSNHLLKIEAIRRLNVSDMRALIFGRVFSHSDKEYKEYSFITVGKTPQPIICRNQMEVYYAINQIDLNEFTGIYGKVTCVLPGHDDNTPSAVIWNTDDGTPIYHCFGCGKSRTIISLVEAVARCSTRKAINFIKSIYNITFELTDKIKKRQQELIDNANYLDRDDFKITFPYLSKVIRTRKHHLQSLLLHFSQYVTEDGIELNGKILFWGSYPKLIEICRINPNSVKSMAQTLTLFTLLSLLIKVPHVELPDMILNKAKHIAAKNSLKKMVNFYQFPQYGYMTLHEAEEIAKDMVENNFSITGSSREFVIRTWGVELADKVFPQYVYENKRGTSERSDEKTRVLIKRIFERINTKGYCLVNEIISSKAMYEQWKRSITEVCNSYGLKTLRLNKELKSRYKIECDGYPSVIIKGE